MTKLKLIMLCVLSLSLLAEEEFYEVIEGVSDTQYEEIGVVSEPTILESLNKDKMDVIKFESEIEREKEAEIVVPVEETEIVKNIEQNVSIKESINPIFVTYDEALKIAKEENKIILLDVVANNCAFCKKMEEEVLSKDNVQEAIKKDFVLAHVNEDREPLPLGLSPQMTPTFVFISKTETVEDMRFGFIDEEKFLILLEKQNEDISNR
jgi:thioredoxin-related protein